MKLGLRTALVLSAACLLSAFPARAERPEIESSIRREASRPEPGSGRIRLDSSYEYGDVKIDSREADWTLFTGRLTYSGEDLSPYFETEIYQRSRVEDQKLLAGADWALDGGSAGLKAGFGLDADFISRFELSGQLERRLQDSLYWSCSGRYLDYAAGDVGIVSPGLAYYFGDHSLGAQYNVSVTESRGTAQWASLQGRFVFQPVSFFGGAAAGQRLFDIDALESSEQNGYILFAGLEYSLHDSAKIRFIYDQGREKTPKFEKRGYTLSVSIRF